MMMKRGNVLRPTLTSLGLLTRIYQRVMYILLTLFVYYMLMTLFRKVLSNSLHYLIINGALICFRRPKLNFLKLQIINSNCVIHRMVNNVYIFPVYSEFKIFARAYNTRTIFGRSQKDLYNNSRKCSVSLEILQKSM